MGRDGGQASSNREENEMAGFNWPRRCEKTRWSLILTARAGGESARVAIAELYRLYFYPVANLFAARRGPEAGYELAQRYFVERVLPGKELARLKPDKTPRFRTWLFMSAFAFLWRRRRADCAKQCDERVTISLDQAVGETRALGGPSACPEAGCRQGDSLELLKDALARLREEYCASSRDGREASLKAFDAMKPFLPASEMSAAECQALALELGIKPNTAKKRVSRLQRRFVGLLHGDIVSQHGFEDVEAALETLRESQRPLRPSEPEPEP
jgi:hypothetical protein